MKHIREIDGLRAIAVMAVVLFHAGVGHFKGGFVGVDVFFVISGYLITGILLDGAQTNQLSIASFYVRRILRIAPALFATLAVTAPIFFVLTPPATSDDLNGSLVSAILSYSNFWFFRSVDYFADNTYNPVLHTWSLAIEEQFYLVLPLLLLLLVRIRQVHHAWLACAICLVLSFAAAALVVGDDQVRAFYFPWLRAWELLAGSVLATVNLTRMPRHWRPLLTGGGLLAIAASCLLFDDRMVFPGYAALLPVLGAVAVIAGVGAGGIPNRLIASRPFVWVGKISYSIYLVHWPIVCVAAVLVSLYSLKVQLAIIVSSIVFGWLSWKLIETPFRRLAPTALPKRVFVVFFAALFGLIVYFTLVQRASIELWESFPKALRYSEFVKSRGPDVRTGVCFLSRKYDALSFFRVDQCLGHDPQKESILVMGDSHAANIVAGLAARYPGTQVLQATSSGCRPVLDTPGPPRCVDLVNFVYRDWLVGKGKSVKTVVLGGRWFDNEVEPLSRSVDYLRKLGKNVIVVGPTPEFYVSVPLLLAYEEMFSLDLQSRLEKKDRATLDKRMKATISDQAHYHSAIDQLCGAGRCTAVARGEPILFDREHFTQQGVDLLLNGFPSRVSWPTSDSPHAPN